MKTPAHNREWWLDGVPPWVMEIVSQVAMAPAEEVRRQAARLMVAQGNGPIGSDGVPIGSDGLPIEDFDQVDPIANGPIASAIGLSHYVRGGRQCFYLDRQLAQALAETAMPSAAEWPNLKLPFDGFLVDISDAYEGTRLNHIGASVGRDGDRLLCVATIQHDARMKQSIPWYIAEPKKASGVQVLIDPAWGSREFPRKVVHYMTSTIVNLLAYLNTPNPVIDVDTSHADAAAELEARLERTKSPAKRRKLAKRLEKAPRHTINTIGRGYVSRKAKSAEGCDPRRLHWVRGHWRNQWVGVGDGRRQELRWIAPYQRGEIEPGVVSRTNVVTAEAIGLGGEL